MMRHITWAAAWFLVGLAVVLGTASVLEQRATVAERGASPVAPAIAPAQQPEPRTRPTEEGRQLVAYRRSAYSRQHGQD
jgi:hypothetical protein